MVETGFELWSVLLEGLLCDTVYAILPIVRKAYFSSALHRTDEVNCPTKKFNPWLFLYNFFYGGWRN